MNQLLFYANPEVVLEVEDPHLLRKQFKDNCMDLVHANMELVTLCTECHSELKVTEDHGIIVEPKVEDIFKKMNQIVPTMWSLETLVKNKLNYIKVPQKNYCPQCKKDTSLMKEWQFLEFPYLLWISIQCVLPDRSKFKVHPYFQKTFNQYMDLSEEAGHVIGHVPFNQEIDLLHFAGENMIGKNNPGQGKYRLQGVIVRNSNKSNGTYFAYVRPFYSNSWFVFKDKKKPEETNWTHVRSVHAHLLFYHQKKLCRITPSNNFN